MDGWVRLRAVAIVWLGWCLVACGSEDLPPEAEDLGEDDGQDVVTIGDSWMNLIVAGVEQSLEASSGRDYRNYAVPGTRMLNEQIPGQYEDAIAEDDDIKTVVMTGGGNDILFSPCAGDECDGVVDDVVTRMEALMVQMAADGVLDIVLIGYTYPDDENKHASLDRARERAESYCTVDAMPRCHFLDASTLDIALRDGIHPDDAGYDLLGEEVWSLLQQVGARR